LHRKGFHSLVDDELWTFASIHGRQRRLRLAIGSEGVAMARESVQYTGIGIAIGAGVGTSIGVLIGGWAIAVGMALGAGVGVAIGAALDARDSHPTV